MPATAIGKQRNRGPLMYDKKLISSVSQARKMASELNRMLHEDALQRMRLFKEYGRAQDAMEWTPELYTRCQIAEALCEKLEVLLGQMNGNSGTEPATSGQVRPMTPRVADAAG